MNHRVLLAAAALVLVQPGVPRAEAAAPAGVPGYITAAVADPARPAADTERDALRKPAETLAFAGVKPGDQVLELGPGRGYFTRLLSAVVGAQGKITIYTVSVPPKPDAIPPQLTAITADAHYANVNLALKRLIEVKPSATFNVVWTTQNYHDFHNVPDIDMATLNRAIFESLKPEGVYLVVDHAADAGSGARDTNTLHRIDRATVISEAQAAGFELVEEGSFLRNAGDPHTEKVFEGSVQGHTDQFALKFRKPKK
jgi:predicted methyltransferase